MEVDPHPSEEQIVEDPMYFPIDETTQMPIGSQTSAQAALTYLKTVKEEFSQKTDVYNHFLDIMRDFRHEYIDTIGVIQEVCKIFKEKPDLIIGFNTFLPYGYKVRSVDGGIFLITPQGKWHKVNSNFDRHRQRMMNEISNTDGNSDLLHPTEYSEDIGSFESDKEIIENPAPLIFFNKVRERFVSRPKIFRKFLDLLHLINEKEKLCETTPDIANEENEDDEVEMEDLQNSENPVEVKNACEEKEENEEGEEVGEDVDEEEEDKTGPLDESNPTEVASNNVEDENNADNYPCPTRHLDFNIPVDETALTDISEESENEMEENADIQGIAALAEGNYKTEFIASSVARLFAGEPDLMEDFMKFLPEFSEFSKYPSSSYLLQDFMHEILEGDEFALEEISTQKKQEYATSESSESEDELEDKNEVLEKDLLRELEKVNAEIMDIVEVQNEIDKRINSNMVKETLNENEKKEEEKEAESAEMLQKEKALREMTKKKLLEKRSSMTKAYRAHVYEKMKLPKLDGPTNEIIGLLTAVDMSLYKKLKRRVKKKDLKKIFLIFNLFMKHRLSLHEMLRGLKDVIGKKYGDIYNDILGLFGEEDNLTDDDDTESDVNFYDDENEEEMNSQYPNTMAPARKISEMRQKLQVIRDFENSTISTLGMSYRHIKRSEAMNSSGRTRLCKEVLNDVWTSYPSWSSEDNGNVSSKKSPYEEFLYRTEDERFELDIVLDVNKYAIESLELLRRKIDRMNEIEKAGFKLDDKLGCTSGALMTRAIRRIYGGAATDIIKGMKENPTVAVTKVLNRCIEMEKEWRESQTQMNRMWREQLEKQMVRSLDHQTSNVKQADARLLKTKSLIHQVETFFDQRQTKHPEHDQGPHLTYIYPESRRIFHDVNDIIIHYLKRQTSYSKDDKRRMKIVLRKIILEWFCAKLEDMSDDENEDDLDLDKRRYRKDGDVDEALEIDENGARINLLNHYADDHSNEWPIDEKNIDVGCAADRFIMNQRKSEYRVFYGDDTLFIFLRLHQTLCERFSRIHSSFLRLCDEYYEQERMKVAWEKDMEKNADTSLLNIEKNWGELGKAIKNIRNIGDSPLTYYNLMIGDTKRYLDGEMEAAAFEDAIRSYFPTEACLFFSIDKILALCVKMLSTLANNEDDCHAIKMYMRYRLRTPPTTFRTSEFVEDLERDYAAMAENRLHGKNCFRFEFANHDVPSLSIMLVDTEDTLYDEEEQNSVATVDSLEGGEPVTIKARTSEEKMKSINRTDSTESSESVEQAVSVIVTESAESAQSAPSVASVESDKSSSNPGMIRRDVGIKRLRIHRESSGIPMKRFTREPLFMERSVSVRNPNRSIPMNYDNFAEYAHNPMSAHRGGFYFKKPLRAVVTEAMRRARKLRLDRSTIKLSGGTCQLLETGATVTRRWKPNYPHVSYNVYSFSR